MAKTAEMRLIELMVLKQDISAVIEYIGKKESFQFQKDFKEAGSEKKSDSAFDIDSNFYTSLRNASVNLGIPLADSEFDVKNVSCPSQEDRDTAARLLKAYNELT